MPVITPEEARAYLDRWALVEAMKLAELRNATTETKLRQLASLMASRNLFAADPGREGGVREVRERWTRIRQPPCD